MDKNTRDMLDELNKKGIRRVALLAGYFGKNQTMIRWNNKTKRALQREDISGLTRTLLLDELARLADVNALLSAKNPVFLVRMNTATGNVSIATGNHPYSPHWAYGGD